MKLSILCQSPVFDGMTQAEAIHNTLDLAHAAERLGFERFWVAEHHQSPAYASAAPEVLIPHIAATTTKIRVGAGGMMMAWREPEQVAEQFKLLDALFPGRIDLGFGRGNRVNQLAPGAPEIKPDDITARYDHLLDCLAGDAQPSIVPVTHSRPETWLLGTSPRAAEYAGRHGLAFSFGAFLDARALKESLQAYRDSFIPSATLSKPRLNLALVVVCAKTTGAAKVLARSSEGWFVEKFLRRQDRPYPTHEQAQAMKFSLKEQTALSFLRRSRIVGDAPTCREGLSRLAETHDLDDFTLVTIVDPHPARIDSYRSLAEVMAL